ncbi:MAG TPA: hypothetical protein VD902_02040 [Symbiobacteriaceae bacterium]|nr:hypothetical protein [Symbiobacteriaceae bacterium]
MQVEAVRLTLGALSAALVAAMLAGLRLPLITTYRAGFIALLVLGMAMCSRGMQLDRYGWWSPFNVAGMVVGVAILGLAGAVLLHIKLPMVPDDRMALIILAGLMALKVLLALVRGWVA